MFAPAHCPAEFGCSANFSFYVFFTTLYWSCSFVQPAKSAVPCLPLFSALTHLQPVDHLQGAALAGVLIRLTIPDPRAHRARQFDHTVVNGYGDVVPVDKRVQKNALSMSFLICASLLGGGGPNTTKS